MTLMLVSVPTESDDSSPVVHVDKSSLEVDAVSTQPGDRSGTVSSAGKFVFENSTHVHYYSGDITAAIK